MNATGRFLSYPFRRAFYGAVRRLPATVRDPLLFEFHSWLGRRRSRPLLLDPKKQNYLNVGAAADRMDGFIGVDFFSTDCDTFHGADLRYPLKIDDNVVDGIFSEHTIEHLTYEQAENLLRESHRIMKPGGTIRVIVPDVSIFVERYAKNDLAWFAEWEKHVLGPPRNRKLISKMAAISFVTQEYGHQSSWDFETLSHFLTKVGFTAARKCAFRQGANPKLLVDMDAPDRTMLSLYAEAEKPASASHTSSENGG